MEGSELLSCGHGVPMKGLLDLDGALWELILRQLRLQDLQVGLVSSGSPPAFSRQSSWGSRARRLC